MPIPGGGGATTETVLQEWVDEVRYHLEGPRHDPVNILNSSYTAGSGTLVFRYPLKGIVEGALLCLGENTFLVLATDEPSKTATVTAGYLSSTDADAAAGSLVRVNPQFTDHRIVRALNETLSSLTSPSNGLFAVQTVSIDYTSDADTYDLDAPDMGRILSVWTQKPGSTNGWSRVRAGEWELLRDADTDTFPSGLAIRVTCAYSGYRVRVLYAGSYSPISGGDTLVGTSGIHAEAEDIPPLGAAINLMAGREIVRNSLSSQGDSRRATEVPQGAVQNSWQGLAARLRTRTKEESLRLRSQAPPGM